MSAWLALVVFVAAYLLIATEKIHRVKAALLGAAGMVAVGAANGDTAFFSQDTGIDWNVIFLLLGMMIIVGVLKRTGVFEFMAIWAAKRARARPFPCMVLLVLITAGASALLDNVTTVLLVAPVTLLVCDRLGTPPIPFLLAEVMASNIGGTATLIGDPPNIIIASRAGLTFNDFLVHLAPMVVVLLIVFIGLCWLLWGRHLSHDAARAARVMALDEREAINDRGLLIRVGLILAVVLAGFILHPVIHLEPSVVALLGAGAAVVTSGLPAQEYLEEVEWETLVFFTGLFIMVGGLVHVGLIEQAATAATGAVDGRFAQASVVLLVGSGILSGIVDNIPYVATMSPLVADLVAAPEAHGAADGLWWALALGADLGGNATAIGASANVVVTGIAARNGHPISFWHFTRYGLVVATVTIALCIPYVVLRYF